MGVAEEPYAPSPTAILETRTLSRIVSGVWLGGESTSRGAGGEGLGVAGPSGSGKSSLLRLLNRLDEPTSGTVYFEGKDYRTIPPPDLRRRMGMVTQTPFLFPGTVADNLRFGPEQHGQALSEETIALLLEQVGLPGFAASSVEHLSGGEAQRISLARALANRPSILLLDEPTSALDEKAKQEVETLISGIVRQSALTCMIVTHDWAQAARMADRVLLLERGKLKKIGPAQEVLNVKDNFQ